MSTPGAAELAELVGVRLTRRIGKVTCDGPWRRVASFVTDDAASHVEIIMRIDATDDDEAVATAWGEAIAIGGRNVIAGWTHSDRIEWVIDLQIRADDDLSGYRRAVREEVAV